MRVRGRIGRPLVAVAVMCDVCSHCGPGAAEAAHRHAPFCLHAPGPTPAPARPAAGMVGGGGDSGRLAQFVSNASFATLTLIYTFTELLDLSDQVGGWLSCGGLCQM